MRKIGNILWGIVFIIVGLIWALNATGIADINIFFKGWWTLFIIVPCAIGVVREQDKMGNIIGLIIGAILFLLSNDILNISIIFKLIIPLIFIFIGISIIFRDMINKKIYDKMKDLNKQGLEEYYATFSGQEVKISGDEFKGTSLNAIFGGIDFDLRDANINEDKIINASAIFGGIDIIVPTGVNVKVKSTPIFGGVGNKTTVIKGENIPTIYINALCLFGGVDIK